MRLKPKFALRLRNPEDPPDTTSTPPEATSKPTQKRHNSLHQEKENRKRVDAKKKKITEAVDYCYKNKCKGYKAISALNLQYCKGQRTINAHLERYFEGRKMFDQVPYK